MRVPLPGGRVLAGTVPGVGDEVLRLATFSRLAAKHRLAAWVRLLALAAGHPGRACEARTVGRAAEGGGVVVARLRGPEAGAAREQLAALVDLHDRGLREPLPFACATSAAYALAAADGSDPSAPPRASGRRASGTTARTATRRTRWSGGERPIADLLAEPAHPDEPAGAARPGASPPTRGGCGSRCSTPRS